MKRIFFYSLFFLSIGLAYRHFSQKPIDTENNDYKKNQQKESKEKIITTNKAIPQKDNRIIPQDSQQLQNQEPVLIDDSMGQPVSYDPNDLVSCETQIGNCLPKPEPEPEDPNANTFCITYASNCNSQESIQRKWSESEVFKKEGEEVNPETIPRDSSNILDEYNRKGLESMRRRNAQQQMAPNNFENEEANNPLGEFNEVPDYSDEQQEEY